MSKLKMKIFQIFYNNESNLALDPIFIPFDNSVPDRPDNFEYGVMRRLYLNPTTFVDNDFLGVMSWKFQMKTNVTPATFVDWINKNNDADIYTINPFSNMNKQFSNLWLQGEYFHPGLIRLTDKLFRKAGIDTELLKLEHPADIACYCNYWVANKRFWNVYMSYTEKLYKAVYESDEETKYQLFHVKADKIIKSGYFSFIFERMFSTVLRNHQEEFNVCPYFL